MSRLDRLVVLLDTGSSAFVRNTAADQLADVQKLHPEDLLNLLGRVFPYLRSKKWETRIASARAIGGIVSNASKWDPNSEENNVDIEIKDEQNSEHLESSDLLSFASLDFSQVLKFGGKLVGSAGKEYDDPWTDLDPVERLKRMKQSLKQKLGMAGQYMEEEDLLSDIDLKAAGMVKQGGIKTEEILSPSPPKNGNLPPSSTETVKTELSSNVNLTSNPPSGLSAIPNARMRAMAKRKAKNDAKAAANKVRVVDLSESSAARKIATQEHPLKKTPSGSSSPQEMEISAQSHNNKIVVEHKAPKISPLLSMQGKGAGRIWPFEGICELLMLDLFDPAWEVRHGAVMGLREVIRVHGGGAGRILGKSKQENDKRNKEWLEDLSCRLCCIFALDRFGDYVSDQVVAPVRESAAQALGALLLHLPESVIYDTFKVLRNLVLQKELGLDYPLWEACHGGMLGLRYLVSVRRDLLVQNNKYFDGLVECVLHGLRESDDDVQAMGAATLLPITEEFVIQRPNYINQLLDVIWDCLGDLKDDLSASIGNVMDLLAKLCAFPVVLEKIKQSCVDEHEKSFSMLVPRLYPFLRHSITNVRKAVLRALETFLSLDGANTKDWITGKTLRLLFQNLLVEQNEVVLEASLNLWNKILDEIEKNPNLSMTELFEDHLISVLTLLMTPIGTARHAYKMDTSLFIKPSGATYRIADAKENEKATKRKRSAPVSATPSIPTNIHVNIDNPIFLGDVQLVGRAVLLRTKIAACVAFGRALSMWESSKLNTLCDPLISFMNSPFSTRKLLVPIILEEYGKNAASHLNQPFASFFSEEFMKVITSEEETVYRDLVPFLKAVRTQCQSLLNVFVDVGKVSRGKIPAIAIVVQGEQEAGPDAFSLHTATKITTDTFEKLKRGMSTAHRITSSQVLNDANRNVKHAIDEAQSVRSSRDVSIHAACASSYVHLATLPKKLNPIIRSMMDSMKGEEEPLLQNRIALSVASLVTSFMDVGKSAAAAKIIKNLCGFLCVDTSEVPEFHHNEGFEDIILSLRKEESKVDVADIIVHQREVKAARVKRLGGKTVLKILAERHGDNLFNILPNLKECMLGPLRYLDDPNKLPNDIKSPESTVGQEIIDAMSIIRALLPYLGKELHQEFFPYFRYIENTLSSKFSVLRYAAAKCFATICSVMTAKGITSLVENVIPKVSDALNLHSRMGAIECIYHLIGSMGNDILPYVVFLLVPVLGRMSDSDQGIRLLATTTFASIIKLVPLEAGIPDPPGMPEKLLIGRDKEREFISQMMDVSKVKPFSIPVEIKADLRKYQQDGVNWLAFLNKYHLHGILCDDMGLGKTLQTICIVASDHHLRQEEHKHTKSVETRRLPSLIICPPSLTGHWKHEINTFASFLKVVVYAGNTAIRRTIVNGIPGADIVVTSYDVARNDINILNQYSYNYCVLDEGHIIKNANSKLSKAVKTFSAYHRLILSGTPIQNNVLELWSLFDFLMPGFLGTEKVFNERFAKPIAASKNSKSSSKEQEAGALALEALHKQVLPFMLRRMKEDVLADLPPKIIQDYYCELSDLQKQLYDQFTKSQKTTVESDLNNKGDKASKQHIFQALQYMRKLCNHPALVLNKNHPQYSKILGDLGAKNVRDISYAPKLVALKELLNDCGIGLDESTTAKSEGDSSAMQTTLTSGIASQHRALIFCQLKDMLDMVENDLLKKHLPNVSYMRLDGSVDPRNRQDIVQKFNSDPSIDVLLLTTHVGGLGLNLTGADTVIFVEHDWNPMNDLQAMDRAHRIGQKKVVNVYRLITRNTLEERIMGLQKFKLNIASTIVNQQNAGLNSMDTDQILDLFNTNDLDTNNQTNGKSKNDEDVLDETGQLRTNGQPHVLNELTELWDEKDYEEEYNLDTFISGLRDQK